MLMTCQGPMKDILQYTPNSKTIGLPSFNCLTKTHHCAIQKPGVPYLPSGKTAFRFSTFSYLALHCHFPLLQRRDLDLPTFYPQISIRYLRPFSMFQKKKSFHLGTGGRGSGELLLIQWAENFSHTGWRHTGDLLHSSLHVVDIIALGNCWDTNFTFYVTINKQTKIIT